MSCFKTTHREQWLDYIHIFVNLLWNFSLKLFSLCCYFFSQVANIELLKTTPVHRLCSPVVKSIECKSLVVKWETLYSLVHMDAALVYIYIYIYIYTQSTENSAPFNVYIYIYIYIVICTCAPLPPYS